MREREENILAALSRYEFPNLLQDPEDKAALFHDLLTALDSAGFSVVKPSVFSCDAPAQIKSCLLIVDQQLSIGGVSECAPVRHNLGVALRTISSMDDYLRELERLGTLVPITWGEFVLEQHAKKLLPNLQASGNLGSNGSDRSDNANGIQGQKAFAVSTPSN